MTHEPARSRRSRASFSTNSVLPRRLSARRARRTWLSMRAIPTAACVEGRAGVSAGLAAATGNGKRRGCRAEIGARRRAIERARRCDVVCGSAAWSRMGESGPMAPARRGAGVGLAVLDGLGLEPRDEELATSSSSSSSLPSARIASGSDENKRRGAESPLPADLTRDRRATGCTASRR